VRFGGDDRYDVAFAIAEAMGVSDDGPVVVASGEVFPDALSISASAAENGEPILLVSSEEMRDEVRDFIARGSRGMTVVGGTATIPNEVLEGFYYTRLSGPDRYATNWAVFDKRYNAADHVRPMIASAEVFPDALVLGPYAAKQQRPIILMGKTASSTSLRPWVYNKRGETLDVDVVGGPASVSAYVSHMFEKWQMNRH
jgi:putative cell wall-binding protein